MTQEELTKAAAYLRAYGIAIDNILYKDMSKAEADAKTSELEDLADKLDLFSDKLFGDWDQGELFWSKSPDDE